MRCIASLVCIVMLSACGTDSPHKQGAAPALAYPPTQRTAQVDTYHGVTVADPYRWLEDRSDPATKRWVDAQNAVAQPFLEAIPARERIKQRLTELWNHERYDVPVKRGGRYFFRRNDGLQNQSVLYVADSLDAAPRVVLDPNKLSADATVSVEEIVPSPDGKLVAYGVSDGGTDWRIWRIRDVATGTDLSDELRFLKFRDVAWTADSRTLYYSRYPQRADGSGDDAKQMSLYRHALGASQADDRLVYAVADHPTRYPYPFISDDGRYLVMHVYDGSQSTGIYFQKLDANGLPEGEVVRLFDAFDAEYQFIAAVGDELYIRTNAGSPNARLLAVPAIAGGAGQARTVIAEDKFAMVDASIVGNRIVTQYLKDAYSVVRVSDMSGRPLYDVKLPGYGKAGGFGGETRDPETFFGYTDFLTPGSVSRLDVTTGAVSVFRSARIDAKMRLYIANFGSANSNLYMSL
jgi:prolyl oligopeptidase